MSALPRNRARARSTLLVAAVATVASAGLLAGCSDGPAPKPKAAPPTPIARLNTAAMSIPRIDFCELVPEKAIDAALGVTKWQINAVGNGDKASIGMSTDATQDVVSEHLCTYSPTSGESRARAWTFSPPIDTATARNVIAQAGREQGCRVVKGPRFGTPSMTQVCETGPGTRVRFAGLFGDTWLACEVTDRSATVGDVRGRAAAFCVDVTQALNTSQ